MSKLAKTLGILSVIAFMATANAFAQEILGPDDGVDENGTMVVAPTLAMRCGLDSQNSQITQDCMDRLAYDYKSGVIIGGEFANYDEERKAILGEYAGAYLEEALAQLVDVSGYEDRISKEMCIKKSDCPTASNDSRAEIEYNNKIAADNASKLLSAVKMRAFELNMDSVDNMLNALVPVMEVDLENKSLAGAP